MRSSEKRRQTYRPSQPPIAHTRPSSCIATAPFPGCFIRYTVPGQPTEIGCTLEFLITEARGRGINERTSRSYRPTRWSADTESAIELSSETAIAITSRSSRAVVRASFQRALWLGMRARAYTHRIQRAAWTTRHTTSRYPRSSAPSRRCGISTASRCRSRTS